MTAFEALYLRHRDFVHKIAWRFARDEHECLDVVQDVFAGLLKAAPRLRLNGRLTTYLYPAARNAVATRRRKDKPLRFGDTPENEATAPIPDSLAAPLREAMSTLSDAHREVLLMRTLDDMSMDEIAAALNIPAGTVKSRLHHALNVLRENPDLRPFATP